MCSAARRTVPICEAGSAPSARSRARRLGLRLGGSVGACSCVLRGRGTWARLVSVLLPPGTGDRRRFPRQDVPRSESKAARDERERSADGRLEEAPAPLLPPFFSRIPSYRPCELGHLLADRRNRFPDRRARLRHAGLRSGGERAPASLLAERPRRVSPQKRTSTLRVRLRTRSRRARSRPSRR